MEPVAVVTAFVAALYVVARGGLVIAPKATAAFYRRTIFATDARVRLLGIGLLVLAAVPLVVTTRQAPPAQGSILILLQGLGWITAAVSVWLIAAPGLGRRLVAERLLRAPNSVLQIRGALGVAFGLFLGWAAFFVL